LPVYEKNWRAAGRCQISQIADRINEHHTVNFIVEQIWMDYTGKGCNAPTGNIHTSNPQ